MNNEQLAEMYQLVEKAKLMEKTGQDDKALELYLIIHDKYYPNTSNLYERPAIILEKKRRFDEAIAICEKAIKLIEVNKITGTKEQFQKRIDRIHDRMKEEEPVTKPKAISTNEKKPPLQFNKRDTIILVGSLLAVCLAIGIFALVPKNKSFDNAYQVLSQMEKEATKNSKIKFKNDPDPNLPAITASMVEKARSAIAERTGVKDSFVVVSGDMIGFAIQVEPSVTPAKARALGNEFARALSTAAAGENAKFFSANPIGYGKVYEYYDAFILVSVNADLIPAQGKLHKKALTIKWLER